jgi:hypothetical protein
MTEPHGSRSMSRRTRRAHPWSADRKFEPRLEPRSQICWWVSSRVRRQRSSGAPSSNCSAVRTAHSNTTHAITFQCVTRRRGPRVSQMPSSGSRQIVWTRSTAPAHPRLARAVARSGLAPVTWRRERVRHSSRIRAPWSLSDGARRRRQRRDPHARVKTDQLRQPERSSSR